MTPTQLLRQLLDYHCPGTPTQTKRHTTPENPMTATPPPPRPIAFLDTETTGLAPDDDIWDFACILRTPGKPDVTHQFFVEHDEHRALRLPEPFLSDYHNRFDPTAFKKRGELANWVTHHLAGAVIVGAVPTFDTGHMEVLLRRVFGIGSSAAVPPWHYQIIDVEALAAGYLSGRAALGDRTAGIAWAQQQVPIDSNMLSSAVGVDPDLFSRHTALGDAQWARAIYDVVQPFAGYTRVRWDQLVTTPLEVGE